MHEKALEDICAKMERVLELGNLLEIRSFFSNGQLIY